MAESQEFTRQQLLAMHKTQLIELAESLHIETEGLTKPQLIKHITGSRESVSADDRERDPDIGEVFKQVEAIHSPPKSVNVKSVELPSDTHMTEAQMNYALELKRMEMQQMQMQQRQQDREMQERLEMAKMEHDLKARELNRPIPQPRADVQPTFKVEVAAKLLPIVRRRSRVRSLSVILCFVSYYSILHILTRLCYYSK